MDTVWPGIPKNSKNRNAEYCKWYARRKIPKWQLAKEKLFSSSEDSDITSNTEESNASNEVDKSSYLKPTGSPYQPINWAAKLIKRRRDDVNDTRTIDDVNDTQTEEGNTDEADTSHETDSSSLSCTTTPIIQRQRVNPATQLKTNEDNDEDNENEHVQKQILKNRLQQRWRNRFKRNNNNIHLHNTQRACAHHSRRPQLRTVGADSTNAIVRVK